jgi:hypothetical protein
MLRLRLLPIAFIAIFASWVSLLIAADTTADAETYPVRIIFEQRLGAKFYQIEWLEHNDIAEQGEASPNIRKREKITKTEIRRDLPARFKYFRMRSAYRDGLFGPWGEIVEIQRTIKKADANKTKTTETAAEKNPAAGSKLKKVGPGAKPLDTQNVFVQVLDKDGHEKWVLRGGTIAADQLDGNTPLYYTLECLTNKDSSLNVKSKTKYESPITFNQAGQYKLDLYKTDDAATAEPLQTWIFWVYTDVPRTYVKFYAPFLHGKGGFTVGGKTKIALLPQYSGAAIDKIEYRVYKDGDAAGAWQKYEDEIEINSFARGQYGYFNIEYQTTNVAGATEIPQVRRMLIDATGPVITDVPATADAKERQVSVKDENYPIVVRIYQNGRLVRDRYYKLHKAHDTLSIPAGPGIELRAIDLLGNETIQGK